jgi:pantoate--beta-alanine ligase
MTRLIKSIPEMKRFSALNHKKGRSIGFVPTMGYLHEGHSSLVKRAIKDNDVVVVSIFVNPTQFGPKEDLKRYPRDLSRDMLMLKKLGADAVFCPDADDMYPKGYSSYVEVQGLQDKLCGATRPGHFRGVATVITKLFNIVKPDIAYFGRKDFQQQAMIKQMVKDLNMDVKITDLPTIREAGGLAMSSRNSYLEPWDRANAEVISHAIELAKAMAEEGVVDAGKIKSAVKKLISTKMNAKIDYISVCDPSSFNEVKKISKGTLLAIAVVFGKTRLIDNALIK